MLMWALLVLSCFTVQAKYMPVPSSISSKAVYHMQAHQIDEWSCGYNALFNACNLENTLGFKNSYSNFKQFNELCTAFIRRTHKGPRDGISNMDIEKLATQCKLQNIVYLNNGGGKIAPLLNSPTTITIRADIPDYEVQRLLERAITKREQALLTELKKELEGKKLYCIHFVCHVFAKGEDHCILVSLVQKDGSHRGLYIFDNMNSPIQEGSEIKRYIDFLCTTFKVSTLEVFNRRKIILADKWPTTPLPPTGYYYKY